MELLTLIISSSLGMFYDLEKWLDKIEQILRHIVL